MSDVLQLEEASRHPFGTATTLDSQLFFQRMPASVHINMHYLL
jgi:hypothetical protein